MVKYYRSEQEHVQISWIWPRWVLDDTWGKQFKLPKKDKLPNPDSWFWLLFDRVCSYS